MKKVNNLLLKAFAVFAVFTMVSCSNDDDNTNTANPDQTVTDPFIGSWKAIGYAEGGEYYDIENDECESGQLIVNEDYTGTLTSHDCNYGDDTTIFNWGTTSAGDYFISVDSESSIMHVTFEDDKMKWYFDDPSEYNVFQRQ